MTRVRACTMRGRCQQLPQIPVLPSVHPDLRKVILPHQLQNMLRVLAIRLLLPPPLRADLGRVADPQIKLQLGCETLEPTSVPTGLNADAYCLARTRESTVILPRLVGMCQPFLLDLSGRGVEQSDLSQLAMEIYAYNDHRSALQKLRRGSFDDLESEVSGFAFEIVNLQFAVLSVVKLRSSVDECHAIAQHAINQSSQLGSHSLNGNGSPELS